MCAEIVRSVASLSWIDKASGLPQTDDVPPARISRGEVIGEKIYRFSNFLEVRVIVTDHGQLMSFGFTLASGMYRSPSEFNFSSAPVGKIGRFIERHGEKVVFRQIVGCRTASPEKAGAAGGVLAGAAGGAFTASKLGVLGGWPGMVALGAVGAVVGGYTGEKFSEQIFCFPPIWTELELTVYGNGSTDQRIIKHSLFPSINFYVPNAEDRSAFSASGTYYDGNPNLQIWKSLGWGPSPNDRTGPTNGNPWHMFDLSRTLNYRFDAMPPRLCPENYECN